MENFFDMAREFLELESKMLVAINNLDLANTKDLTESEEITLRELLKRYDVELFGTLLGCDQMKKSVEDYLQKFYLSGDDDLSNKEKYQSNLSILLDDYFEIEGEENFQRLISAIPRNNRNHPEIVKAIRFVYDLEDEDGLPIWMH